MYKQFFGLKQEPFSIAPDPRYLFMSERHREALAHLLYGLRGGGGFVLLTGEIGAGKTTVCRCFLEQIPKRCNVAYIFNPKLTVEELLQSVCEEFHIGYEHVGPGVPTVKDYVDALNGFLLKTHAVGQNNVLIIDEAQNLSADVLEQLRLLTNLETSERKLLQIILIGQPELRAMVARPELEQLAQRVIARYHLKALSELETAQYIRHRLSVAGLSRPIPFDREARKRVHELARGIPRRINLLCDRALLGAYADGKARVDRSTVDKAATEVFDNSLSDRTSNWRHNRYAVLGVGVVAGAMLLGLILLAVDAGTHRQPRAAAKASSAPASASMPGGADVAAARAAPASAASSSVPSAAVTSASGPVAAASASATRAASAPATLAAVDLKNPLKSPARNEREAWRELAKLWNLSLGAGDPCRAALQQQVQCFRGSSTLALIRRLDRPGMLSLHDQDDKPVPALLIGFTDQGATLRIGGMTQTVSLPSLEKTWRGEFATFWRTPPGYAGTSADSSPGPLADWVSARLARLNGDLAAGGKQAGDLSLKSQILAFQSAQGLKADGLIGPLTLMQLNRATGVDEPRLQSER